MTAPATTGDLPRRSWVEQLMGLPVSVHLRGPGSRSSEAEARVDAMYDELRASDALFSTYRPESQVNQIDRGELAVEDAHPLVHDVVALCETARAVTSGAFDAWRPVHGRRTFMQTRHDAFREIEGRPPIAAEAMRDVVRVDEQLSDAHRREPRSIRRSPMPCPGVYRCAIDRSSKNKAAAVVRAISVAQSFSPLPPPR